MPFDYQQMGREKKVGARKGPEVPLELTGLPERLGRAMRQLGFDQPRLAQASGVSQPTISNLLRGQSLEGVTGVVVARLAMALGVPSGWLLTAEGDVIPRVKARAGGSAPVVELEEGRDPLVPQSRQKSTPPPALEVPASRSR